MTTTTTTPAPGTTTTTTLPPQLSPGRYAGIDLTSPCVTQGHFLLLLGFFTEALRLHFSSADYIEEPSLRQLIWNDTAASPILIETNYNWTPGAAERRPALIVKQNSFKHEKRGIGKSRHGNSTDAQGNQRFNTFWVGSYTVFCIAREPAHAILLAIETSQELEGFGPVYRQMLRLMSYELMEIGPLAFVEESKQHYVIPITVAVATEHTWKITQQRPLLKQVGLTFTCDD